MPYPGLDAEQSAKVDSCVEKVMASGKPKENAIPICIASVTGKSSKEIAGMLERSEKEITDLLARKESWRVGAARDLPLHERGAAWNAEAAKSRVFTLAGWPDNPNPSKARRAFLLYDADNDENQGAYKDPIADVVDGQLKVISAALGPAASRLPQTDAPQEVLDRARGVLDGYYSKLRKVEGEEKEKQESGLLERFVGSLTAVLERITHKEGVSLDEMRDKVWRAFNGQYAPPMGTVATVSPWVVETFTDHVIVESNGKFYHVPFTEQGNEIVFAYPGEWSEVEKRTEWVHKLEQLLKEGRRHSTKDQDMLQTIHDHAVDLGANCPMVMKQADGRWRWVMLSSNAYEDTDGEIVSLKALADDVERADRTGDYGVLDWWHMPALKLGACDFNAMHGNVLVESGTFHNDEVGAIMSKRLKQLQGSLTFFHPVDEPDSEGVFHHIRRAARALLPAGKAANLLTAVPAVTRKGSQMPTLKEKWTEFVGLLDGKEDLAKQVVSDAEAVEKQAADMRLRHKEPQGDAPKVAEPAAPAPDLAAQFQAAMQPILDEIKSLKEQMGAQTSKAADEDGKRAGQVADLQKQIKEQRDALAQMETALKELMGEQPRGATKGFRPSQDAGTILHGADKEAFAVQPNPLDSFLKDMGMLQPGG